MQGIRSFSASQPLTYLTFIAIFFQFQSRSASEVLENHQELEVNDLQVPVQEDHPANTVPSVVEEHQVVETLLPLPEDLLRQVLIEVASVRVSNRVSQTKVTLIIIFAIVTPMISFRNKIKATANTGTNSGAKITNHSNITDRISKDLIKGLLKIDTKDAWLCLKLKLADLKQDEFITFTFITF